MKGPLNLGPIAGPEDAVAIKIVGNVRDGDTVYRATEDDAA